MSLQTSGPDARICEVVVNTLPRNRTRNDMHRHPQYYGIRNHLIEFLVNRSRQFREELTSSDYDPRKPPVTKPGLATPPLQPVTAGKDGAEDGQFTRAAVLSGN